MLPILIPHIICYINPYISIQIPYNITILAGNRVKLIIIQIPYKILYKFPIDPLKLTGWASLSLSKVSLCD